MSTTTGRTWTQFVKEHGSDCNWVAPVVARNYLGVSKSALHTWSQKGCPYLGGRCLRRKRFHVRDQVFVDCYFKADLDKTRQAKFLMPTIANSRGDAWITKKQAAKITGYHERHLRRLISSGSPFLSGRRIATRRRRGVVAHGRTFEITLVLRKDIEELVKNRERCRIPYERVPIRQAAQQLGLASHKVLHQWLLTGCPHLNGRRKPDVIQGPVLYRGQIQPTNLLLKSEVEEIRQKMLRAPFEPFVNADGKWWPIDLALKKFGNARRGSLYRHKNKLCPQLSGRKLRAITFRRTVPGTYRQSKVWAFHEDDLLSLQPPEPGGRRQRENGTWAEANGRTSKPDRAVSPAITGIHPEEAAASHGPELGRPTNDKPKPSRGRRKGTLDPDVQSRKKRMLAAWDRGQFSGNKAAAARAFSFHRPDVSKWIKEHERSKRKA